MDIQIYIHIVYESLSPTLQQNVAVMDVAFSIFNYHHSFVSNVSEFNFMKDILRIAIRFSDLEIYNGKIKMSALK